MLYTLSCSPWHCDIDSLLRIVHVGDDLLLIQDGVLAAVNNNYFFKMFIDTHANISALKEDIEARGLINKIASQINIIGYDDFISLSIKQPTHISW